MSEPERMIVMPDGQVLIDTSGAVLLDTVDACRFTKGDEEKPLLALELAGRVNQTQERQAQMYMFDDVAALALVTSVAAQAISIDPTFMYRMLEKLMGLTAGEAA